MSSIKSNQLGLTELKEANEFLTKDIIEKKHQINNMRMLYMLQIQSKIEIEKTIEISLQRDQILTERNQENIQVQRKLKTEIENLERDAYFFKKIQEYLQEKNSELNRKLFKLEQRQKLTNDADFDDVKEPSFNKRESNEACDSFGLKEEGGDEDQNKVKNILKNKIN